MDHGMKMARPLLRLVAAAALAAMPPVTARAQDPLLEAAVGFAGAIAFLASGAPGFVIAAVRHGETAFAGFGETARGSGVTPGADTMLRIGSISKVFCGAAMASLAADAKLGFTDPLADRLDLGVTLPQKDGKAIRLIDLVTHAAGLPREVPTTGGAPDDPFRGNTRAAMAAALEGDPLLFAPGTAAIYSNFGFDLLGAALAEIAGEPYIDLLERRIFGPLGMPDTLPAPRPEDADRLMQGHDFDGSAMPFVPTPVNIECAGGLYSTASDMQRWMGWHLDRFAAADAEMRLLDHAAYLYRDGLEAAAGFDEGGPMDAIGLGWVIMMPEGARPLILQKTGGLQGVFSYVAIAPTRGTGVFVALNQFSVGGLAGAIAAANGLITDLAPR